MLSSLIFSYFDFLLYSIYKVIMINSKYKSNRYDQSSTYALTLHEVLGAAGLNFKPYAAWRRRVTSNAAAAPGEALAA